MCVGTIGGIALLLRFSIEKKLRYTRGDVLLAAGSMLSAGVSIFCGHLAMDLTNRALSVNQFVNLQQLSTPTGAVSE
jgi:uncharacterized membrane protein YgdD (TMEM256/DUF423 family)